MFRIANVRCNHLINPIGIDCEHPEFSWNLVDSKGQMFQKAYRIQVYDGEKMVWDSGRVEEAQCMSSVYLGDSLLPATVYEYKITVWDTKERTAVSDRAFFETGLMTRFTKHQWQGSWIGTQCQNRESGDEEKRKNKDMGKILLDMMNGKNVNFEPDRKLDPCFIFRKRFEMPEDVKPEKARIYMTAHGIYRLKVNGWYVSDELFAPGFTNYYRYLEYQTYDVTPYLRSGDNEISFILADGWFKGKFGILGLGDNYGSRLCALMEMAVFMTDGTCITLHSDESFEYVQSPYVYSDLLIGEKYDARLEALAEDDKNWRCCQIVKDFVCDHSKDQENKYRFASDVDRLYGCVTQTVKALDILKPIDIFKTPKGELVVDFGQNMVGHVRIYVRGEAGCEIKIEHTEVLDKDGNFINCVDGFNRDQTDIYILKGKALEVYEPEFTFHGFRYVRITGWPGKLRKTDILGVVVGTDCEITGSFQTSDPRLNQLQSNILWSQRGNILSIPTDCPQRERAGWTGDVWVYGKTCCFNQDMLTFFKKWLTNIRTEQFENGLIPIVIPYIRAYEELQIPTFGTHTSAGWGDVIVALPWYLYEFYGDRSVLEENFESMKRWVEYVRHEVESGVHPDFGTDAKSLEIQKYLWNTNFHFGDWLYPSCCNEDGKTDMYRSANTTKEYVATAVYANTTKIFSKICRVLGKEGLADAYEQLNQKIRYAFEAAYVSEDGRIANDVQGLYVMALAMDMIREDSRQKLADRLALLIKNNGGCLDTGFMSIGFLMDTLCACGKKDTAKLLLYQERCPSWLYEVKMGATTMWETWNAVFEDGTVTRQSYNHYAFGCIGDWMYKTLMGLKCLKPGYSEIQISPDFDFDLKSVSGSYKSCRGKIEISWEKKKNQVMLSISIPANIHGYLHIPAAGIDHEYIGNGKFMRYIELKS